MPKQGYKPRMDVNDILKSVEILAVVRRSPYALEFREEDGVKRLSEDCITDEVFNYSMNLLGNVFNVDEHLQIRQTGIGRKDWDGVTMLSDEDALKNSEDVPAFPIYFMVKDLQNVKIPYTKVIEKQSEYDELQKTSNALGRKIAEQTWEKGKPMHLEGLLRVNHIPTNLNYWHVTLDIYPPDKTEPIMKGNSKWHKKLRDGIFDYLATHYQEEWLDRYEIPKHFYMLQ